MKMQPGYKFTTELLDYYRGWLMGLQEAYAPRGLIEIISSTIEAKVDEVITVQSTLKLTAKNARNIPKIMHDLYSDLCNEIVGLASIQIQSEDASPTVRFIDFRGFLKVWDDKLTAQDFKRVL